MKKNIKKAFSLIEVIWGVLILSIIIVSVTGIFTGILVSTKKSEKLVVATNLAQKQLEYIKLMGFSDIPTSLPMDLDGRNNGVKATGTSGHYFPAFPVPPEPLREVVDGVTYYYRIQVKDLSGVPGRGLVSITVTVYWDQADENSGKNFVSLELYKAQ
ncbi:MAG: type II secretion system protein [Candidatus Eremiobacterota bacterium]